jgi:hypothetical protein
MRERNLSERLEFLLDHDLISFIKKNNIGEVCIFSSILQELRQYQGSIYGGSTSNIPTMQDIGNFLGLPYDQQRIGNTRPRIVHGSLIKLKEFLDMSMAQTSELNEVDERQIQTPG